MRCEMQKADSEILVDYCAGRLPAEEAAEVERHTSGCATCNSFVRAQMMLWEDLDGWPAPPVSEQFDSKLYARIGELEAGGWRRWLANILGWRRAYALATVCAAILVAFVVYSPTDRAKVAEPTQETTRAESIEPEQVERTLEDLEMLDQLSSNGSHNL